jgi:hypothetical protein
VDTYLNSGAIAEVTYADRHQRRRRDLKSGPAGRAVTGIAPLDLHGQALGSFPGIHLLNPPKDDYFLGSTRESPGAWVRAPSHV